MSEQINQPSFTITRKIVVVDPPDASAVTPEVMEAVRTEMEHRTHALFQAMLLMLWPAPHTPFAQTTLHYPYVMPDREKGSVYRLDIF